MGSLNPAGQGWIDFTIALDEGFTVFVLDQLSRQAADQLAGEPALLIGIDGNTTGGAAIVFANNHVLGHVHQTAGEVARVSGP